MKVVKVMWVDTTIHYNDVFTKEQAMDLEVTKCVTYGLLLRGEEDGEEDVILASEQLSEDGGEPQYRGVVVIPVGCIEEIVELYVANALVDR